MSVYHIPELTYYAYLNVINKFNQVIFIVILLLYICSSTKRNNYKFKSVKAIFCDSETLYPEQKTALKPTLK